MRGAKKEDRALQLAGEAAKKEDGVLPPAGGEAKQEDRDFPWDSEVPSLRKTIGSL